MQSLAVRIRRAKGGCFVRIDSGATTIELCRHDGPDCGSAMISRETGQVIREFLLEY
jgi:hypothetical protein